MRSLGLLSFLVGLAAVVLAGCGGSPEIETTTDPPVQAIDDTADQSTVMTPDRLRRLLGDDEGRARVRSEGGRIVAVDLRGMDVDDISAIEGLPLRELFLEETSVTDLSPLRGMPLTVLYLNDTPVEDPTPLEELPLEQLNLVGTKVTDLSFTKSLVNLKTIWLRNTALDDLSPLKGRTLDSLDVENTPVDDLSVVATIEGLKRLNIARTAVTDVSPLSDVQLTRLILTPSRIETGLDAVRAMTTLDELDVRYDGKDAMKPAEFWAKFDAGELDEADPDEPKPDDREPGE